MDRKKSVFLFCFINGEQVFFSFFSASRTKEELIYTKKTEEEEEEDDESNPNDKDNQLGY